MKQQYFLAGVVAVFAVVDLLVALGLVFLLTWQLVEFPVAGIALCVVLIVLTIACAILSVLLLGGKATA